MLKERWTRRRILQTSAKFAALSAIAPLAAACVPQTDSKVATLETRIAQLEAEKQTPQPEPQLPVNIRVLQPEEFNRATEEAMREKAQPSPTHEPSPTPKPAARPTVIVRELTPSPTKEQQKPATLWKSEFKLPQAAGYYGRTPDAFLASENSLLLSDKEGYPTKLTLTKGETVWRWDDEGTIWGSDSDVLYVLRPDMRFFALDKEKGNTKWRVIFPKEYSFVVEWPLWNTSKTAHLPVTFRGALTSSWFASINKQTGDILWWGEQSSIIGNTEKTLVAHVQEPKTLSEELQGIDPLNGTRKWGLALGFQIAKSLVRISDKTLFYPKYLKPYDATVRALIAMDIDSGQQLWDSQEKGIPKEKSIQILNVFSKQVYATIGGQLLVLAVNDGEPIKTFPNFTYRDFIEQIQNIGVLSYESTGFTHFIDFSTGKEVVNDDLRLNRLVGIWKGTLVGVYNDPNKLQPPLLYGVDLATGQRKWRMKLENVTHKTILHQDKILYGKKDGFAVIDTESGKVQRELMGTFKNTSLREMRSYQDYVIFVAQKDKNIGEIRVERV